jgi:Flp pilus assembly protein TadD
VVLLAALGKRLERQGASRRGIAIEYYRAARARRPRLGIALSGALIRASRAEEAEDVLRDLLRQEGETPTLHNDLGICLDAQKKHKAAEAAYRRAIDLAPDYAIAHSNLGMCLADQQRYEAAARACRKAIDLRPDWAGAYYNLGNALTRQGKHGDAEAAFRQAIARRPDFALAHNNLGMALSRQQKPGAEAAYRQAIAHQPDLAEPYNNLGGALAERRKHGDAEAAFRQAIARRPDFALAHFNLAHLLGEQGRFDEALALVNQGNALLPAGAPLREQARPLLLRYQRFMALDARLPAVLRGAAKPANPAEQIEFARVCLVKKLGAAAAHFYDDAFIAEPKLGEDVPAGNRYYAACAAALAGCGCGRDADTLDDKERARWRRQAREWLRQDLT